MPNSSYSHGTVSIGTTATLLATVASQNDGILVKNQGTVTVYLGSSTVTPDETSTGGYPVAAGDSVRVPSVGSNPHDLYAIVASSTASVSFIQPLL